VVYSVEILLLRGNKYQIFILTLVALRKTDNTK